jgi:hypothetical protein
LKSRDDATDYRSLDSIRSVAMAVSNAADIFQRMYKVPDTDQDEIPDSEPGLFSETLRLWASVLSNTHVQMAFAKSASSNSDGAGTWIEPQHVAYLEKVALSTHGAADEAELASRGKQLRSMLRSAFRRSDLLEPTMAGESSADWLEFKYRVLLRLEELNERVVERAVDRISTAADESEKGAKAIAQAAGKTGDEVMSSFYAKLAKTEADDANKFRRFTVGFAVAGGALALIFVLLPTGIFPQLDAGANDYVRLIQKTVLIAGVFGIAGYFARQAHQHRSMANWAESLSVQLQTFDAYVLAVVSDDVKDELRKNFAARAFGDHPAMKGEPTVTPSAAAMDTAVEWAAKLTGGSGK